MKNLFKLLGIALVVFLSYSIYDYNYGDGEDWIHILDKSGEHVEPFDFSKVPSELPQTYESGAPVEWNRSMQSHWINDDLEFVFRDDDSTKLQAILIIHRDYFSTDE